MLLPQRDTGRFVYVDRQSGQRKTDPIYAAAFLDWCYNTPLGGSLTRAVLSRRFVSKLYGYYYRLPWTRRKIAPFAEAMGVNLAELAQPLSSFRTFGDFITRKIDPSHRPIDPDPCACVSPADGRVMAYQAFDAGTPLRIKGGLFDLAALLRDDALARRHDGGSLVIVRLYLADYHHFHFPDAGIPGEPRAVAGRYFSVSPYARHWAVPFYGENHRLVTLFDSEHFGRIVLIEIGSFTVGSVCQTFAPNVRVAKGEHKGFFELGGSVVVMLFEPGAVRLADDLCENTRAGVETYVRMGEAIGRSAVGAS
jgi:phosphatidylserine decarboxylase